jgi:hypothetical protein
MSFFEDGWDFASLVDIENNIKPMLQHTLAGQLRVVCHERAV